MGFVNVLSEFLTIFGMDFLSEFLTIFGIAALAVCTVVVIASILSK